MIGKVISHYKIVEKLGEGGMGVVYKAEDTKLERTVALKFLPSEAASSDDDKARFMEEARAAAALDHPNICTVYEINEAEGQTYIAMAFVDGRSLKSTLEERPLKINDALKYAVQIAKGLGAAHERGIVHRDIKSANIMITPRGRAKIMDFGLARRGEAYQQVVEESTLGTISYSSPEQVSGAAMDHRTDIWSFGVTLFEMVTGQLPFRGDYEQAIVYSILNEPPEPVTGLRTGVPVELERIIDKALAKNPNDRYQHIDDMLLDLKSLQNELDPTMSKTGSRTRTRPIYRQEVSWFRKMLDRHVVQILFVYLAATWGATRLMAWAVDRFVLSPHLTSIVTVAFLSLLPTVVMLGFFRGARAQTDWTKPEKIGIPLNILASLALLLVMFQGKEIGAATTTIAVENEEGQTIERVVPKNEFRKKLALYLFENTSGDTTLNWLQYTIPDLLEADLLQDQFLRLNSAFNESSFRQLKSAGFTDWLEAPVALKRKIARESHLDFFVFGSVRAEGNAYVIDSKLYDTRSGKLVADRMHAGADLFSLIDAMSAQIKRDMGVPAGHTEGADDVAVAEMLTNSVEAAKHLGLSRKKFAFEKDWEGALEHLESAVNEDPTLAWAHFQMYGLYRGSGQTDKSNAAIELAMQHLYKLPERVQFVVKANYYFAKGDTDKTFAVFKMMTELYPADILGHLGLSEIYGIRNEFEKASAEYKTILELDPYRYDLLHIVGDLSVRLGKYDEALFYYQRYADLNPEDANSFTELGNFFERIGDYEKASANFEKALVIDPNKVAVLIDLGDIERKLGRSGAALQQYENALQKARTAEDRARAYHSMKVFYEMHGQINKAIEYTKLMLEERTPVSAPLTAQLNRLDDVHLYVRAGRSDEAFEILKDVEQRLESPYDKIVSFGYAAVYLELGDADRAQEATDVIEEFIRSYGFEVLRPEVLDCQGRIAEARGDYGQAIVNFEKRLELNPSAVTINRDIGRCRRHLKDYQSAEASLRKVLDVYPVDPETNYELAMVYDAMGETSKAAEKLQISLDVWKQADEGYKPAVEARELSERLKSSPPQ